MIQAQFNISVKGENNPLSISNLVTNPKSVVITTPDGKDWQVNINDLKDAVDGLLDLMPSGPTPPLVIGHQHVNPYIGTGNPLPQQYPVTTSGYSQVVEDAPGRQEYLEKIRSA